MPPPSSARKTPIVPKGAEKDADVAPSSAGKTPIVPKGAGKDADGSRQTRARLLWVETILEKRGVAIAASAIVFPLRAATRLSHFEGFARRDGGWTAQSSSLWTSSRANFLIQGRGGRSRGLPAVPAIETPRF
jgi:hypothetical protein